MEKDNSSCSDNVIAIPVRDKYADYGAAEYMLEHAHGLYDEYVEYCESGDYDNADKCINSLLLFRLVSRLRDGVPEYDSEAISCLYTWAWFERLVTGPNPQLSTFETAREGIHYEIFSAKAFNMLQDDPYYRVTRLNYEIAKLLLYKASDIPINFGKRLTPYRYQLDRAAEVIGSGHSVIVRAKHLAKSALTA